MFGTFHCQNTLIFLNKQQKAIKRQVSNWGNSTSKIIPGKIATLAETCGL